MKHEVVKREKIEKTWENLWLPTTVDWSYRTNRFELGSRSDPASWLEEPYRCVIIGCLLIDLMMLIDSYCSMIVRFTSWVTRGFLSPLFCLLLDILFVAKENLWDQGTLIDKLMKIMTHRQTDRLWINVPTYTLGNIWLYQLQVSKIFNFPF